jgi:hypothetical protein
VVDPAVHDTLMGASLALVGLDTKAAANPGDDRPRTKCAETPASEATTVMTKTDNAPRPRAFG